MDHAISRQLNLLDAEAGGELHLAGSKECGGRRAQGWSPGTSWQRVGDATGRAALTASPACAARLQLLAQAGGTARGQRPPPDCSRASAATAQAHLGQPRIVLRLSGLVLGHLQEAWRAAWGSGARQLGTLRRQPGGPTCQQRGRGEPRSHLSWPPPSACHQSALASSPSAAPTCCRRGRSRCRRSPSRSQECRGSCGGHGGGETEHSGGWARGGGALIAWGIPKPHADCLFPSSLQASQPASLTSCTSP